MRFLNTILLVLILLLLCAAGALLYLGKLPLGGQAAAPVAVQAPPPPPAEPLFVELKPFTTMLTDTGGMQQMLYLEITVRLHDEKDGDYLTTYMPEVRNRVLSELSRYSASKVQSAEDRSVLAENLRRVISLPYPPGTTGPNIMQVLFTAFVVQ